MSDQLARIERRRHPLWLGLSMHLAAQIVLRPNIAGFFADAAQREKDVRPMLRYLPHVLWVAIPLCGILSGNYRIPPLCEALERVFREYSRVLKPEGLMAFSFHHGDADAWKAVASALHASGFTITSVQPVKAEMSTSSTKHRSKEPNNLDSIVVCRPVETANKLGARSAREATAETTRALAQEHADRARVDLKVIDGQATT